MGNETGGTARAEAKTGHRAGGATKAKGAQRLAAWSAGRWAATADDPALDAMLSGPSRAERRAAGKGLRAAAPRRSQADWDPAERPDPIEVLEATNALRVPELVPIRYGRMLATPFTYYRGAPAVMAADLATAPSSGLLVQACGDAHLLNFGLFATPERHVAFDVNDFDETHPAPWEWDVKRLVASLSIAARDNGQSDADAGEAARRAAEAYRVAMARYAAMGRLDVWYSRIDIETITALANPAFNRYIQGALRKAGRSTSQGALPKMTEVVDGRRKIVDEPPLITHVSDVHDDYVADAMRRYRDSLDVDRRVLFDHYELVDMARKVVGVGSVGTRAFVLLLVGADGADPLFLQVKEAVESVLAPFVPGFSFSHQGERVVIGQRLMQAASDIFLGWTENLADQQRHYYVRQLRDMKVSADVASFAPDQLAAYGALCGWTLARAHAKTGDSSTIAGYLGSSGTFDQAMTRFALAYADQNEADYERFRHAVNTGRLFAVPGV